MPLRTSCDRGYPDRQHLCAWLSGNPLYIECHFIGFRLFRLINFVTLLVPCSRYNYLLLFCQPRVEVTSCFVYKVMGLTFHNRINPQLSYRFELAQVVARRITKPQRISFQVRISLAALFFVHFFILLFSPCHFFLFIFFFIIFFLFFLSL